MIDWDSVLILLNTIVSTIVLWSSICATNRMTPRTPHLIRLAFVLLGAGAAATLLTPAYLNRVPTAPELLMMVGVASLTIGDKRRRSRRLFMNSAT